MLNSDSVGLLLDGHSLVYSVVPNTCSVSDPSSPLISSTDTLPYAFLLNIDIPSPIHFGIMMKSTFGDQGMYPDYYTHVAKRYSEMISEGKSNTTTNSSATSPTLSNDSPTLTLNSPNFENRALNERGASFTGTLKESHPFAIQHFAVTPATILQSLPELPTFLIISRRGHIARTSQLLLSRFISPDHSHTAYMSMIERAHFGDVWKHKQLTMFEQYKQLELDSYKRFVKLCLQTEKDTFGRILSENALPAPNYHPPPVYLATGKFRDLGLLAGISPLPFSRATNRVIHPTTDSLRQAAVQINALLAKRKVAFLAMREEERRKDEKDETGAVSLRMHQQKQIEEELKQHAARLRASPMTVRRGTKTNRHHHANCDLSPHPQPSRLSSLPHIFVPLSPSAVSSPDPTEDDTAILETNLPHPPPSHSLPRVHTAPSLVTSITPTHDSSTNRRDKDGEEGDLDWSVSHPSSVLPSV
ncbi:hypothetical protein BLNAU_15325 [Blattamonas nauphoetae]|uniref:Uncharacterized protein n=1 Tax=Blattamonas nauphoetae TaxID=2049346 RepID=A0ABQ9XHI5_9EUKA|nr:hypothetical protein BLNAU_15325 [Blattamonas nauphoetae]